MNSALHSIPRSRSYWSRKLSVSVAQLLGAHAARPATLSPPLRSALASLAARSSVAGSLIYRGEVHADSAGGGANRFPGVSVFHYERRVQVVGDARVSTHLTFRSGIQQNQLLVAQEAIHSSAYELRRFQEIHAQTGQRSQVQVEADGGLLFDTQRGERSESRREPGGAPVVVGPTLFGYVLAHWPALLAGETLMVRFAAADRGRSYGFALKLADRGAETTCISFAPVSFLVRLGVKTMRMTFSNQPRQIASYQGLVPPLLERGPRLQRFDARVVYQSFAPYC